MERVRGRRTREGDGPAPRGGSAGASPSPTPVPRSPAPRLGIVADDLTGAVDTGVQFARWGLHTLVMLENGPIPESEVVVVTTDSRDEPPEEAYRRTREAARLIAGRLPYKKIDSTLRGNLGPELDGLLDGLEMDRALVAPAFPATGRTTVDGIHMVHGIALAESPFARDPLWPATESHVPTLLARQTRRTVGHLPLEVVERGPEAVATALRDDPADIVVADATEVRHLRTLAFALGLVERRWLPCGCAGLAEEWPAALGCERPAGGPFRWPPDPRPALVVAGSRNRSTAQQLRQAAEGGVLEIVELSPGGDTGEVLTRIKALLEAGRSVALTTTFSEYQEGRGKEAAEELAREAALALKQQPVAGVFMTGGDIARAVCRQLGAAALHAMGEVQPGVAMAELDGGIRDRLRVVTKAGGFGDERAILRSIACLRGEEI